MKDNAGGRGELAPGRVQARERENEAVRLRLAGMSFDDIAKRVGYTNRSAARKAVQRAVARDVPETEGLRAKLIADTEMVIERLAPLVDSDDPELKAVDRFLKALDLQARLGGVYRPDQPSVTVNNQVVTVTALEEHGRRLLADRLGGGNVLATTASTGPMPMLAAESS
jgi:hypothetical protein